MATLTEIEQKVIALGVRIADEIDAVRAEIVISSGGAPDWSMVQNKPSTFTPAAHTQTASTITDFNTAVDARIAAAGLGGAPDWASITGKPSTFAPAAHNQTSSTITDFNTAVDARIALAGSGAGNVAGDSVSVDGELALFLGTTGKAIKRSNTVPSANGLSLISAANYAAMRTSLGLAIGTDVQAYSAKLGTLAGQTWAADKITYQTSTSALATTDFTAFGRTVVGLSDADGLRGQLALRESIIIAVGDETTALTAGTGKVTFRMPYALTNVEVRASLTTAQASGSIFTIDVNESGTTILSTKLTIDNTEKSSTTAATAPFVSDVTLADDAEITIDIDQIGNGTAKGLKVYLIGRRP